MIRAAPIQARPGPIDSARELPPGPLYVFGYGSLLWRPGFDYRHVARARVYGFHRALRVWSVHHRGTEDHPGLVLGLDAGGSCLGSVFEVPEAAKQATAEYLWAREMVTDVYTPRLVRAHGPGGAALALTFVLDRGHGQYAGTLAPEEAARHIRDARGRSGPNPEYVRETLAHLQEMGVHDRSLDAILRHLEGP
ncbi:MAG: gamma-glutamylcyclotransferase [Halofilum sp. (in: g-proteobacteria)]|nr:gamma-glutamylcyclotransferase [Halofilum sp. (in: g-proteobacteria)]